MVLMFGNFIVLQKCTCVNKKQKERCIFLNFWNTFTNLCAQHGESATTVLKSLGLSKGNAQRWKNGGGPTLTTAAKIAAHFGIRIDDLVDHSTTNDIP